LPRRRSVIRQKINMARYSDDPSEYIIVYIDRDPYSGPRLAELPASRIKAVSEWAMHLDDDWTVIPLHRVVEIRRTDGSLVWRRRGSQANTRG